MTTQPMPELPRHLHQPGDSLYGTVNELITWGRHGWAEVERLDVEVKELVDTLQDRILVVTGPCQANLIDRCRCWRCVNQRVDAVLDKFKEQHPCQP